MNIRSRASRSINAESGSVGSFSNDTNSPLYLNGNLVLTPFCKSLIESIKSNSPKFHAVNLSENVSRTVNSTSVIDVTPLAVTNPTGLNLSPTLNEWPSLAILNDFAVDNVVPIPTVNSDAPTSIVISWPEPVSVVAPTPNLEIPVTGKLSYDGCGIVTIGFM